MHLACCRPAQADAPQALAPDSPEDEDDEDGDVPRKPAAAASGSTTTSGASTSAAGLPGQSASMSRGCWVSPRLRTRLFASSCLLHIFAACSDDKRHQQPTVREVGDVVEGDWLIKHLQVGGGWGLAQGDRVVL
jgi:hypothetical protein